MAANGVLTPDPDAYVRLESDGTTGGTKVTVDGKPVMHCMGASWNIRAAKGMSNVEVELDVVPLIYEGRARFVVPSLIQCLRMWWHYRPSRKS